MSLLHTVELGFAFEPILRSLLKWPSPLTCIYVAIVSGVGSVICVTLQLLCVYCMHPFPMWCVLALLKILVLRKVCIFTRVATVD